MTPSTPENAPHARSFYRLPTDDAVILDIGLPRMDGHAVARRLRQQRDCDHMLLIALSGYGTEQDCAQATAAGFDHHLTKPANLGELHAMLRDGRVNR